MPSMSTWTAFMSQYTIMYCNYTKSKEWDKMLLVTLVKMNLTTKKRKKKKSLSKFIVTLDNIQKEKVAK